MRAEYRTACVKFRMDDEEQVRAWEYLHSDKCAGQSFSSIISKALLMAAGEDEAEPLENTSWNKALAEMRDQICFKLEELLQNGCTAAGTGIGTETDMTSNAELQEKAPESRDTEEQMAQAMLSMSMAMDEDDD